VELEEFFESEVVVAVAATLLATSPRARGIARKGAVYGIAGALAAGDALKSFGQSVSRGAKQAADSAGEAIETQKEKTSEG
jgi:hypothetical protein